MILELKNIEKSFGDKKVLKGVSLRAEWKGFWNAWTKRSWKNNIYPYYDGCIPGRQRRGAV